MNTTSVNTVKVTGKRTKSTASAGQAPAPVKVQTKVAVADVKKEMKARHKDQNNVLKAILEAEKSPFGAMRQAVRYQEVAQLIKISGEADINPEIFPFLSMFLDENGKLTDGIYKLADFLSFDKQFIQRKDNHVYHFVSIGYEVETEDGLVWKEYYAGKKCETAQKAAETVKDTMSNAKDKHTQLKQTVLKKFEARVSSAKYESTMNATFIQKALQRLEKRLGAVKIETVDGLLLRMKVC